MLDEEEFAELCVRMGEALVQRRFPRAPGQTAREIMKEFSRLNPEQSVRIERMAKAAAEYLAGSPTCQ